MVLSNNLIFSHWPLWKQKSVCLNVISTWTDFSFSKNCALTHLYSQDFTQENMKPFDHGKLNAEKKTKKKLPKTVKGVRYLTPGAPALSFSLGNWFVRAPPCTERVMLVAHPFNMPPLWFPYTHPTLVQKNVQALSTCARVDITVHICLPGCRGVYMLRVIDSVGTDGGTVGCKEWNQLLRNRSTLQFTAWSSVSEAQRQ